MSLRFLATMWVYPDFFTYNSGIYRRSTHGSPSAKGFHSVRLVGWGEERYNYQTTKYWVSHIDSHLKSIIINSFSFVARCQLMGKMVGRRRLLQDLARKQRVRN